MGCSKVSLCVSLTQLSFNWVMFLQLWPLLKIRRQVGLPTPHLKKGVWVPMTTQHQSPCCPSSVQPMCQMPPISKAHVSSKLQEMLQEMLQGKGGCPLKTEAQLHPALMAWVWGSHGPTCSFSTHVKRKQLWVPSGFIFSEAARCCKELHGSSWGKGTRREKELFVSIARRHLAKSQKSNL